MGRTAHDRAAQCSSPQSGGPVRPFDSRRGGRRGTGQCDSITLQATVGTALAHCTPRDWLDQRRHTPWLHGGMPLLCRQDKRGAPGHGVVCLDDHTPWHSSHGKTATVTLSRSLVFPGHRAVFRAAGIGAASRATCAQHRALHKKSGQKSDLQVTEDFLVSF